MAQSKGDIASEMKKAMAAGQFDKAAAIGVRILKSRPERTDIQIMTAVSDMQGKHPRRALQRLRKLMQVISPNDRLFNPLTQNLKQYAYLFNDFKSVIAIAEASYNTALDKAAYGQFLADVIFQNEKRISPGKSISPALEHAKTVLEDLVKRGPANREIDRLLVQIYLHGGEYQKAIDRLESLTSEGNAADGFKLLLSLSYGLAGQVENAVSASLELINTSKNAGAQPYLTVAFLRPQSMPENAKQALQAIVEDPRRDARDVYNACFALARISEFESDMKTAFDWYQAGHAANRKANPFDIARELAHFDRLAEFAGETGGQDCAIPGHDVAGHDQTEAGPKPIFIVGMPRSGTTLTERILGAHPDVYGAGEIGDLARIMFQVLGPGTTSEQIARLDKSTIGEIRSRYLSAMKAYAPGARFVTNKTPANFMRLDVIRRAFPDAPVIHIHRHPLATCLSLFTTPFGMPMRYADDLGDLAAYYRGYEKLMAAHIKADRNGRIYDLRYEDLINAPENVAQAYLAHCGLDWDPQCLEFYRDDKAAQTASVLQVRRPVNSDSLGKWKRFASYIGPLAELAPKAGTGKTGKGKKTVAA